MSNVSFVSISPEIKSNRESMIVDLSLQINETPRVFVERIDIGGNVRTLDKVIRRELQVVEGDQEKALTLYSLLDGASKNLE